MRDQNEVYSDLTRTKRSGYLPEIARITGKTKGYDTKKDNMHEFIFINYLQSLDNLLLSL